MKISAPALEMYLLTRHQLQTNSDVQTEPRTSPKRLQRIGVATVCYKEAKRNRRAATATRVDRVSN